MVVGGQMNPVFIQKKQPIEAYVNLRGLVLSVG